MKAYSRKVSYYFLIVIMLSIFTSTHLQAKSIDDIELVTEIKTFLRNAFELPSIGSPNVKVEKSGLTISTSAFLHINESFGDMKLQSDNLFKDQLDLTHKDHLLFYGLIDSLVKIDLGINVMKFSKNSRLNKDGIVSDINIDKYTPALYAHVEYAPAKSYFSLVSEGSVHTQGDSSISDYKFYLNLSSNTVVDTEIGFHRFNAEWQNIDGNNEKLSFKGYYARVTYNF